MSGKAWTAAQVRALGVRTDGVTACSIVYGVGRTRAYEILRSGTADFRVIRIPGSNRFVVPTSEILRILFEDADTTPSGTASEDRDSTRMHLVADAAAPAVRRRAG